MTRIESITTAYAITVVLSIIIGITVFICTRPNKSNSQEPEKEGVVIDGHNIEVVYDDYGAAYLKYVIQGSVMYIPVPPEIEVPDNTDSLKFYYTKTENNGRYNNKRNAR